MKKLLLSILLISQFCLAFDKQNINKSYQVIYNSEDLQTVAPNYKILTKSSSIADIGEVYFNLRTHLNLAVDTTRPIDFAYNFKINLEITSLLPNGLKSSTPKECQLSARFNPKFQNFEILNNEFLSYSITNSNGVEVKVKSVEALKTLSGQDISATIPNNIKLVVTTECFEVNFFNTSSKIMDLNHVYNKDLNSLELNWTGVPNAMYYEVQWTWIDNYGENSNTKISSESIILSERDFSLNHSNIKISQNTTNKLQYQISLLYDKGYLIYQVRPIGIDLAGYKKDLKVENLEHYYINGQWNNTNLKSTVSDWNHFLITSDYIDNINTEVKISFAEDGKKKEVVSYYDGSLRNRQVLTKTNSNHKTIIGETIYDAQGRPAVTILPTPAIINKVQKQDLRFENNFNTLKSESGILQPLNFTQFDIEQKDTAGNVQCKFMPFKLDETRGASFYYSQNNDSQANLPIANGFPYSQTVYTNDGTGRVSKTGSVGEKFSINDRYKAKQYVAVSNDDIAPIFGAFSEGVSAYRKELSLDENRQMSFSYFNVDNKLVASGLSGQVYENGKPLFNPVISDIDFDEILKKINIPLGIENGANVIQKSSESTGLYDETSLSANFKNDFIKGDYELIYNLGKKDNSATSYIDESKFNYINSLTNTKNSYDYAYAINLAIKDECGDIRISTKNTNSESNTVTNGFKSFVLDSNPSIFESNDGNPVKLGAPYRFNLLGAGKYQLNKDIRPDYKKLDVYMNGYKNELSNFIINGLNLSEIDFTKKSTFFDESLKRYVLENPINETENLSVCDCPSFTEKTIDNTDNIYYTKSRYLYENLVNKTGFEFLKDVTLEQLDNGYSIENYLKSLNNSVSISTSIHYHLYNKAYDALFAFCNSAEKCGNEKLDPLVNAAEINTFNLDLLLDDVSPEGKFGVLDPEDKSYSFSMFAPSYETLQKMKEGVTAVNADTGVPTEANEGDTETSSTSNNEVAVPTEISEISENKGEEAALILTKYDFKYHQINFLDDTNLGSSSLSYVKWKKPHRTIQLEFLVDDDNLPISGEGKSTEHYFTSVEQVYGSNGAPLKDITGKFIKRGTIAYVKVKVVESKIKKGTFDFFPEVESSVKDAFTKNLLFNGKAFIRDSFGYINVEPQYLLNVEDFLLNWDKSWAYSLVGYHPEAKLLDFYHIKNSPQILVGEEPVTLKNNYNSEYFDFTLSKIQTPFEFAQAFLTDKITPTTELDIDATKFYSVAKDISSILVAHDPYFNYEDGFTTLEEKTKLKNQLLDTLNNNSGSSESLWKILIKKLRCSNNLLFPDCTTAISDDFNFEATFKPITDGYAVDTPLEIKEKEEFINNYIKEAIIVYSNAKRELLDKEFYRIQLAPLEEDIVIDTTTTIEKGTYKNSYKEYYLSSFTNYAGIELNFQNEFNKENESLKITSTHTVAEGAKIDETKALNDQIVTTAGDASSRDDIKNKILATNNENSKECSLITLFKEFINNSLQRKILDTHNNGISIENASYLSNDLIERGFDIKIGQGVDQYYSPILKTSLLKVGVQDQLKFTFDFHTKLADHTISLEDLGKYVKYSFTEENSKVDISNSKNNSVLRNISWENYRATATNVFSWDIEEIIDIYELPNNISGVHTFALLSRISYLDEANHKMVKNQIINVDTNINFLNCVFQTKEGLNTTYCAKAEDFKDDIEALLTEAFLVPEFRFKKIKLNTLDSYTATEFNKSIGDYFKRGIIYYDRVNEAIKIEVDGVVTFKVDGITESVLKLFTKTYLLNFMKFEVPAVASVPIFWSNYSNSLQKQSIINSRKYFKKDAHNFNTNFIDFAKDFGIDVHKTNHTFHQKIKLLTLKNNKISFKVIYSLDTINYNKYNTGINKSYTVTSKILELPYAVASDFTQCKNGSLSPLHYPSTNLTAAFKDFVELLINTNNNSMLDNTATYKSTFEVGVDKNNLSASLELGKLSKYLGRENNILKSFWNDRREKSDPTITTKKRYVKYRLSNIAWDKAYEIEAPFKIKATDTIKIDKFYFDKAHSDGFKFYYTVKGDPKSQFSGTNIDFLRLFNAVEPVRHSYYKEVAPDKYEWTTEYIHDENDKPSLPDKCKVKSLISINHRAKLERYLTNLDYLLIKIKNKLSSADQTDLSKTNLIYNTLKNDRNYVSEIIENRYLDKNSEYRYVYEDTNFEKLQLGYISENYLYYVNKFIEKDVKYLTEDIQWFVSIKNFPENKLGLSFDDLPLVIDEYANAYMPINSTDVKTTLGWNSYVNDVFYEDNVICEQIKFKLDINSLLRSEILASLVPDVVKEAIDPKIGTATTGMLVHFQKDLNEELALFLNNYLEQSLDILVQTEDIQLKLLKSEYHHTLYFYDDAGNLIQTVAPEGVYLKLKSDRYPFNTKLKSQLDPTSINEYPLATKYAYNSLNQLIWQSTPDGGETVFAYDELGRIVASQNAEQQKQSTITNKSIMSYTSYDALGRIVESGELTLPANYTIAKTLGKLVKDGEEQELLDYTHFPSGLNLSTIVKSQVTKTVYTSLNDLVAKFKTSISPSEIITGQTILNHTRNRVAAIYTYDEIIEGTSEAVNVATVPSFTSALFYSYDVHGNVTDFYTYHNDLNIPQHQRLKTVNYEYDLISGKVNKVTYQPLKQDQFIHLYEYDADNRLVAVKTSKDNVTWETDANYSYYDHGPLQQTVIGDQKVQTLDYAYTLQGWLKYVNGEDVHNTTPTSTTGHPATADAFGYALHYFKGDYESNTVNQNLSVSSKATAPVGVDLYNGNINTMVSNTLSHKENPYSEAISYKQFNYDQLNRIHGMNSYDHVSGTNEFNNHFKTAYAYDKNGNLLNMARKIGDKEFDNFTYQYNSTDIILNPNTENTHTIQAKINNQLKGLIENATETYSTNDKEEVDITKNKSYVYNEIGQLIKEFNIGETQPNLTIDWRIDGKVAAIVKKDGTKIVFNYDGLGNRIAKKILVKENGLIKFSKGTLYQRDAQGNTLAVYNLSKAVDGTTNNKVVLAENHIYGSSRLGVVNGDRTRDELLNNNNYYQLDDLANINIAKYTIPEVLSNIPSTDITTINTNIKENQISQTIQNPIHEKNNLALLSTASSITWLDGFDPQLGLNLNVNLNYFTNNLLFNEPNLMNFNGKSKNTDDSVFATANINVGTTLQDNGAIVPYAKIVKNLYTKDANNTTVATAPTYTQTTQTLTLMGEGILQSAYNYQNKLELNLNIPSNYQSVANSSSVKVNGQEQTFGFEVETTSVTKTQLEVINAYESFVAEQQIYNPSDVAVLGIPLLQYRFIQAVNNLPKVTSRTLDFANQQYQLLNFQNPPRVGNIIDFNDFDKDHVCNIQDIDDDNDGLVDTAEQGGQFASDTDQDGVSDTIESGIKTASTFFTDANADGYSDNLEATAYVLKDTDQDGIIDLLDTDDDNDGVFTSVELAMTNVELAMTKNNIMDTDLDSIPNYLDTDDDNDGVATLVEANLEYTTKLTDTDQDRLVDMLDPDDDNDTITTRQELADQLAYNLSNDIDDDGKLNYQDADDDGDGFATSIEKNTTNGNRLDANKNKLLDYLDKKGQSLYSLKLAETQNIYANQNGAKNYELTNHLGNVMAVVSNQKTTIFGTNGILSYLPEVLQYNDYDPFGMLTPNRHGGEDYRYGFNTQEKTDEIAGEGNHTTAKYWEYDPRVVQRWNQDPIQVVGVSPYVINGDNPIYYTDPNGDYKTFFGAFAAWAKGGFKGKIKHQGGKGMNNYAIQTSHTIGSGNYDENGGELPIIALRLDYGIKSHDVLNKKGFVGKSMDFVSSHGGYWNDRIKNVMDDYSDLSKITKRQIALRVSNITNIKPGVVFQGIKKSTKSISKAAGTAGKYIEGVNVAIIGYEFSTNTWDAHTFVNTAIIIGGYAAAGTVAAPVVLPSLVIYGAADYWFDISGKIDESVGRDSGIYKD